MKLIYTEGAKKMYTHFKRFLCKMCIHFFGTLCIIHLKAFLFKLDNVLLLKYMYVLLHHKLLHMM